MFYQMAVFCLLFRRGLLGAASVQLIAVVNYLYVITGPTRFLFERGLNLVRSFAPIGSDYSVGVLADNPKRSGDFFILIFYVFIFCR